MFKKLKDKITEEVKISPQRFQQLTQSVSDKLQGSATTSVTPIDESFFSIADDSDTNMSDLNISNQGFSSVKLMPPGTDEDNTINKSMRRDSITSLSSDISFLPKYEAGNLYHLQSDLDVSASEHEDNASQSSSGFGRLSKEQLYSAFKKTQMQYHKYRGRYTDLARHYKEMEREITKMKSVLVETQDKAFRRITELKEQCTLEQKAKAHLESALRDDIDEKQLKIEALQTKVNLLQQGQQLVNIPDSNHHIETNQIDNLTVYLNEARNEIEILNRKIQEFKANSIVSQSKDQEYRMKISDLEREIAMFSEREKENTIKLAENKMELHNELLNKDTEINQLKTDIEILKNTLQEKNEQFNKMDNLQSQNHKLIDKVENLKQKCNTMETELLRIDQYELKINSLYKEIESLNDIAAEKEEAWKKDTEKFRNENKQSEIIINNLNGDLLRVQGECEKLSTENSSILSAIEQQKQSYETQIQDLRESAKQGLLSVERRILEKVHAESAEKEENVLMQLKEKDNEYQKLENSYSNLINENDELKQSISSLQIQLDNSAHHEETIVKLQLIIEDLKQQLNRSQKLYLEKENGNVQLEQEILELERSNVEMLEKVRLHEKQAETVSLETNESDLLQLKLQTIEEEKQALLDGFEEERKVFNELIKENKELKIKDIRIEELEGRNRHLEDKVSRFKGYLISKERNIVDLQKAKLHLEHQILKLQEKVRIEEEHEETLEMAKTEENILLLKLQQLEEEKENLIQSFENEREIFDRCFHNNNNNNDNKKILEINRDEILNENISLAKENLQLKKINEELSEKTLIFKEKEQGVELESCECNLMKLKVHKLETEKDELLKSFEMEREMFNKALIDHRDLVLKEEQIKGLVYSNQNLTEKLAEFKSYLKKKDDEIVELEKIKLELEQKMANLNRNLRIKEEENDSLVVEQTECDLLQMKVKSLENEKETLENSFDVERKLFESSMTQMERTKNKMEEINKHNEILLEDNRRLSEIIRNQMTNIEKAESASKTIRDERDAALRETEHIRMELFNKAEEWQEIETKYDELQTTCNENTKYIATLEETIENVRKEKSIELEQFELNAEELKLSCKEIENVKCEMIELRNKLDQLQNDKDKLENDQSRRLEEYNLKINELSTVKAQFIEIRKYKDNAIAENIKLNEQLRELQNQLGEKNLQNETSNNQNDLLETNNNLHAENLSLKHKISILEEQCTKFNKIKTDLENQLADVTNEKASVLNSLQATKVAPSNDVITKNSQELQKKIAELDEKLHQYKSLDITNKSSLEFYESEMEKLRNKNEKLNQRLDETLVTLNHCTDLSNLTEIEYLRNVLYKYMLGQESMVLARVIAAVCKFDQHQTDAVLQKEQQKQTLLGQLGLL